MCARSAVWKSLSVLRGSHRCHSRLPCVVQGVLQSHEFHCRHNLAMASALRVCAMPVTGAHGRVVLCGFSDATLFLLLEKSPIRDYLEIHNLPARRSRTVSHLVPTIHEGPSDIIPQIYCHSFHSPLCQEVDCWLGHCVVGLAAVLCGFSRLIFLRAHRNGIDVIGIWEQTGMVNGILSIETNEGLTATRARCHCQIAVISPSKELHRGHGLSPINSDEPWRKV